MKEILIIGAGGFGRELLQWIKDINQANPRWKIKGFIDDNLNSLESFECDYKVEGTITGWRPSENEAFTCAIADPLTRERIVKLLKNRGASFVNIVHPTAIIGGFCKFGEGLIVTPRAKISPNVLIGDYVTIMGSGIGHDAIIGDYSTISGNCSINGNVYLGRRVFVGSNVCIAPGRKIGNDSYIGMGSVVVANVKQGYRVLGNPAVRIKF